MFLGIDIGNSRISFALIKGKDSVKTYGLSRPFLVKEIHKILKRVEKACPKLEKVIICSVVPDTSEKVRQKIRKLWGVPVFVLGRDIKVPIKNKYAKPRQVGQDRLICAYAAKELYGSPVIVIDLGTAITLDIISERGEYLGGMIIPGIRLSAESLHEKTALLPKINMIKKPPSLIGRNTEQSILSGLFYGYGAMLCGLVEQVVRELKAEPKVILTGGYTAVMKDFIGCKITDVAENLVFQGMALVSSR